MNIYLIRHGDVENRDGIVYGNMPGFHLSEKGRSDIEQLADRFVEQGIQIKQIYSSPLARTVETAEIISSKLASKVITNDKLVEIDCSTWEGKSLDDYLEIHSKDGVMPGKETFEECGLRIKEVIDEVVEAGEDAILVSHAYPIVGAVELLKGEKISDEIPKGSFYKVQYEEGKWKVNPLNQF